MHHMTAVLPPQDTDEALQAEVAGTLKLLMCKEVGCRDALQHGVLPALLQLLAPQQHGPVLRDAVYQALCTASLFEVLRRAIVEQERALMKLVTYAQHEEPSRAACALDLIHQCTQVIGA
jgi:hypothetical protein